MHSESVLTTRGLNAGYNKHVVVGGVSLEIRRGEVLTLIGSNGAGKSTVLRTIMGQQRALGGRVYYLGQSADSISAAERAKILSAVTTEKIRPGNMTGRDVVETGRYPYTGRLGILSDKDHEAADAAIRYFKAEDVADFPFEELSDGQKQRLMIARAVCEEPDILVLDEPTSYLDLKVRLEVLTGIRDLAREKGIAVIMSLHELDLVRQISDFIACIKDGKIKQAGTPSEIFSGDTLKELFDLPSDVLDPALGLLNFPGQKETPQVFVICGGGCGIPVFEDLVRKRIPFAAGILPENDLDFPAAKRQAARVVSVPAYQMAGEEEKRKALDLIETCRAVLVPLRKFGPCNAWQKNLVKEAEEREKVIPWDSRSNLSASDPEIRTI